MLICVTVLRNQLTAKIMEAMQKQHWLYLFCVSCNVAGEHSGSLLYPVSFFHRHHALSLYNTV